MSATRPLHPTKRTNAAVRLNFNNGPEAAIRR